MSIDIPVSYDLMYAAYMDCRRHKKSTDGAMKFEPTGLLNVERITDQINNRTYQLMPSTCFVVKYPTYREVFCASFCDRIVQHFVINEMNPIVEKLLIRDTASCRVEKGTDYAVSRLSTFIRRETENYTKDAYDLTGDLSGFFMAIDRNYVYDSMIDILDNHYLGQHYSTLKYLLKIIVLSDMTKNAIRISPIEDWNHIPPHKTLFNNEYGLAIGNITSQMFANYSLNGMDHMIKSRHRSYIRYVDDFHIVDQSKEKLLETLEMINEYLPGIHQRLNIHKTQIRDVKFGTQFLGVNIYPYYSCLGKKRINRLYYTTRRIETPEDFYVSASSRKGMFQRYHAFNVANRWYESVPEDFKDKVKMDNNYNFTYLGPSIASNKLIML